jgi:uncharacterized protein
MSSSYHRLAFTADVLGAQERYGSRVALDRLDRVHPRLEELGQLPVPRDRLTADERGFLGELDGFYLATVSSTGWPYVQFRGGPPGFIRTPDEHTIAWADFRGNRQYISVGNLAGDGRAALIFLDYARQLRLKVFGIARVEDTTPATSADGGGALALEGYRAKVEREVRVEVTAYDWNCPQHIVPRYTAEDLAPVIGPMRSRLRELETENARLRGLVEGAAGPSEAAGAAPARSS